MLLKIKYTAFALLFFISLKAQVNLVPNSSFEDTLQCPNITGQINRVVNWSSPTNGSPDIITSNFCNDYLNSYYINVPQNYWGFQNALSGSNYVGLSIYSTINGNIGREYIQVKLSEPLKNGMLYCAGFYTSLADNSCYYAIKDIGAFFSNDSIFVPGDLPNLPILTYSPQIYSTAIVADTSQWGEVSGYFVANGGEEYMLIGNFTPQGQVDAIPFKPQGQDTSSYYYFDNIYLYECDSLIGLNENLIDKIKIYPNPAQDFVSIKLPDNYTQAQLSIYNLMGQLLSQKQITQPNQTIPIIELSNGMYIFVIQNQDKVIGRQRVVVVR